MGQVKAMKNRWIQKSFTDGLPECTVLWRRCPKFNSVDNCVAPFRVEQGRTRFQFKKIAVERTMVSGNHSEGFTEKVESVSSTSLDKKQFRLSKQIRAGHNIVKKDR